MSEIVILIERRELRRIRAFIATFNAFFAGANGLSALDGGPFWVGSAICAALGLAVAVWCIWGLE